MPKIETPEERKARLLEQLAKGRETRRKNREAAANNPPDTYKQPPKKPANLAKIVREILNDDELVDKVVANQPEWWARLPAKNAAYITSTVMAIKAMGGDIKAADWIRKTGWGDKVLLESENGFFEKADFTIQVIPTKHTEALGITTDDVLEQEIKQIEQ